MFKYPDLPISRHRSTILEALASHQVVIVVGETGSGKTTQLPKIACEAAEALRKGGVMVRGRVGCTQPRRIAAASVARRVAEECGSELGHLVGYQVRFEEKASGETQMKFMTDGILLAETQGDPDLKQYHTLIIDEAHERSLNIDFLLGYLKLLLLRRKDLKLVISSATMDAAGFADFFAGAPIIHVEGRTYPVEMHYLAPREDEELPFHVARALDWLSELDQRGDVLVFLPGEREIREVAEVLEGRNYRGTMILPLFARLGLAEQQRVFTPHKSLRRVILATNVAETSLTIPGIIYVIDPGLARVSRYSAQRQVQRLQIEEISQASARQRAGRCGRVTDGVCIRLYEEENFENRPAFTDPEIRRSSLAAVLLRMKALGLPEMSDFPLPDPPSPKLVTEGYRTLRELSALDKKKDLTPLGYKLAKLPVDPRLGRMILESRHENCLAEALVLVAGLSIMDPRERPSEVAEKADAAHRRWKDDESDFVAMLNLWRDVVRFKDKNQWRRNPLRKYCGESFLNFRRVIEWSNLRDDLHRLVKDALGWKVPELAEKPEDRPSFASLHRMILSGVPRQFGLWNPEDKVYRGANGQSFAVFPGSGIFSRKKRLEWVMGVELVETTRLWMRRCAVLEPEWVEQVAPHLCEPRYANAKWDRNQGAVYATERVVCGGLTVVDNRRMHFGRLFPEKAREIFIREGLMAGELQSKPGFMQHLIKIQEEIKAREIKIRKPEQLWCEEAVYEFFDKRLPEKCYTAKFFNKWRTEEESKDKKALYIKPAEAVYSLWDAYAHLSFPDSLKVGEEEYDVYYEYDPGAPHDGVTFGVSLDQIAQFPEWLQDWGVSGNLAERVECLFRGLPKDLRVALQPIQPKATQFAELWADKTPSVPLASALVDFIRRETGLPCFVDQVDAASLPNEWKTKIWVGDDKGRELAFGANLQEIQNKLAPLVKKRFERQASTHWSATGMKKWTCDDLPDTLTVGGAVGYPSLVDEGESVGLKVFHDEAEARFSHRCGCVRFAQLNQREQINHLRKRLPLSLSGKMSLTVLGREPSRNLDDLIDLCVEGGLGKTLPRSAKSYAEAELHMRQNVFSCAQFVCDGWEALVKMETQVQHSIKEHASNRYGVVVAADLQAQLDWMFRPAFMKRSGYYRYPDILRYANGLLTRLKRIPQQPLGKELERVEKLRVFLDPWQKAMQAQPTSFALEDFGFLLDEYRLSLFSPGVPVKGKISEKILQEAWLEIS